ncbi:ATP-binding protein [Desulfoluna limicola]|uniref:ATP-binding protein n=1 Tax=Desulfoluna limicola TaxID=2810562 RepID=A0ABM7PGG9_9BACT|nr:AAA family ATPase [Desulfoluna limicola]BCS96682.1 ATP-binding protein [Desulfoluna limicola]
MNRSPVIIAVCGKGGVGKTCMSALLTRRLCKDRGKRVLAIDADPAVGLSLPLGITVHRTVDDIRRDLIARLSGGETQDREALVRSLDYDVFGALEERDNLAFLAIGRPEGDGCYCQVNAFLRDIIREIAANFDYVIIDAEAGVEQVSRRVMEMVTHLLLVTDASLKGRKVAELIYTEGVVKGAIGTSALLFNRVQGQGEAEALLSGVTLPVAGIVQENSLIRSFDREGWSFFDLPQSEALSALDDTLTNFLG